MRLAAELDVHVYVHTWLKVGGTPRLPGGDNGPSNRLQWTWPSWPAFPSGLADLRPLRWRLGS